MCLPSLSGTHFFNRLVNGREVGGSVNLSYRNASIASNFGEGQWYSAAAVVSQHDSDTRAKKGMRKLCGAVILSERDQ